MQTLKKRKINFRLSKRALIIATETDSERERDGSFPFHVSSIDNNGMIFIAMQ